MTAKIVYGREIAESIKREISEEIRELKSKYGIVPTIATVKVGGDPSSNLYLRLRDKACKEVGIESKHFEFEEKEEEEKVVRAIEELNKDSTIHGILVQYPVPQHISQDVLMNSVTPKKDVEGFNSYNMGKTIHGKEFLVPCTPLSVLTILQKEGIVIKGKDVVIVNHSNIVGKPLAAMFLNRDATVSVCHIFTKDLKMYTCKADILVTATGVPNLITKEHVKENAFVIDVGIVKTENGVCGDVDLESVKEKAGRITPVPGGVGPVTIACSLRNMIKTYKYCLEEI
jgi:methylenetetrahydrofolate dehydrogenase (NADP+)/methenyltetrahydrofolate cyclohydrolase